MNDMPAEIEQAINGLVGAGLNRALSAALPAWRFGAACPEDHGWHNGGTVDDGGKPLAVNLVTCPELDAATADGGAESDRWRVVIGLDPGMLAGTRARRLQHLKRLAGDVHAACERLGARDIVWEVGGP